MIEFQSVTFDYPNGVRALFSVSFCISEGDFVFLTGPTGAGKSTIFKLIHQQIFLTEGRILINGYDTKYLSPKQRVALKRNMGFVFQDLKLLEDRTVFENVALPLEICGMSKHEIHRRVSRMISLVGLSHKTYKKIDQLSCGEQQRVCIARAVAHSPKLLLVDEPTGHLDQTTGWEIMQIFQRIHQEGTTVVVSTHNPIWVERMGKEVITLSGGKIVEEFPHALLLRA